jgi:two-component system, NarL family, sensor histidine kinase DesK
MSTDDCAGPAGLARPGRWLLAGMVWLVALLVAPVVDTAGRDDRVLPLLALLGVVVTTVAPVLLGVRSPRPRPWVLGGCLAALAALAVATTAGFGSPWWNVWILLAATACGAVPGRLGPALVLLVPVAACLTLAATGATGDDVWTVALTTFLAGLINLLLVRLLATIGQLRAAQSELAGRAVVAERERFSRDLHDLLGHTLSVIVVKAEAVRRLSRRDPDAAVQHAVDIETIGRQALVEVREAVGGYRRTTLDAEVSRARAALDAAGVAFEVRTPAAPLPAQVDEALAWVVREGVTNVLRHSGARGCRLEVDTTGNTTRLELSDDGTRPSAEEVRVGGGLTGLRQRLGAVDGALDVQASGGGYRLLVTVPGVPAVPPAATLPMGAG